MLYQKKESHSYFLLIFLFFSLNLPFKAYSDSPDTNGYSVEKGNSITASISTRFRVFEAENCQLSGMKLRAVAESCQASDKLVWKYIIVDPDDNEVIQYSYNFTPLPQSGTVGDNSLDVLNQVFEANLIVLDKLPLGEYKISWTLTINDEYSVSKDQYFDIVDNNAPVPDLYESIEVNGFFIRARDFDKGECDACTASSDNCSDNIYFTFGDKLPDFDNNSSKWEKQFLKYGKYFFNPNTGAISTERAYFDSYADAWIPERNTSERTINCELIDDMKNEHFKVYVWDEFKNNDDNNYNNFSFDNVYFKTTVVFECYSEIAGYVKNINSKRPIKDMYILAGTYPELLSTKTDTNGYYNVEILDGSSTISIQAIKDTDWIEGITTLDIVLLQRHLLGIKKINSPYKLMAGDANNDDKITASDILELRKLILGSKKRFKNHSWIGLPVGMNLQGVNPFDDKLLINILSLSDFINTFDFDAIKIGDINQSANAFEPRDDDTISIMITDKTYRRGEIVEIPVLAKDFEGISGGQFALKTEGLSYIRTVSNVLPIDENNINILEDKILFSWNSPEDLTLDDGAVLFTLNFRAQKEIRLKRSLSLVKNPIGSEFYRGTKNILNLNLSIKENDDRYAFELLQNTPNPFKDITRIEFVLPKASEYNLSIFDLTGKHLIKFAGRGYKGKNSFYFESKLLNHKNVNTRLDTPRLLFYRLTSGNKTAVKRMMIMQ